MNKKVVHALFCFLLLVSLVHAVIPSERAIETASQYLRQGEQASIVSRPYLVEGKQYFVVYFHPQTNPTARNLVIVIDAEDGRLIQDAGILAKVYAFDNKLSFFQEFVNEKKLSFTEIKTSVESGANAREAAQQNLDQVDATLSRVDENIAPVQTAHSQFTLLVERLAEEVDTGTETQDLFDSEYSNQALDALITRYNATLNALTAMVKSGEDYQKAVINRSNYLTQKGVDQNKFKPGLQEAFTIGIEHFPNSASLESAAAEFSSVNSQQNARQVNDSIQSYLYRKGKVDSDNAVASARPSVEEILQRKTEVVECTPIANLEKHWQNTLLAQGADKFNEAIANVTLVENEIGKITRELDRCNENSQLPAQRRDDTNIFIGIVLLLLVGYLAWRYFGKKKEQLETAPPEKKSLFNE